MKGMTLDQFKEVAEFSNKYHGFGRANRFREGKVEEAINSGIDKDLAEYGLNIKYVRCDFDSRDGKVWAITLDDVRFATNHFHAFDPPPKQWKYDNIFDLSIAYLKGDFTPKKEFYIK